MYANPLLPPSFAKTFIQTLMSDGDAFSRFMDEFGRLEHGDTKQRAAGTEGAEGGASKEDGDSQAKEVKDVLMQLEERSTGAVRWEIYKRYFFYAGGVAWIPIILFMLLFNQGTSGEYAAA